MRLSASKRPLAQHCLYWAREDVALPVRESSAAASLGTALHAVADGGDVAALAVDGVDVDDLTDLATSYREWWDGYSAGREWRTEVPFAFDTATGRARRLPSGGQRDYSAALDTEIPGTIDAIAPDEVLDLKTGRPPKSLDEYREQLEHAAVCLSRTTGAREIRITVAHVTANGVGIDSVVLDAFELEEAAEAMRGEVEVIHAAGHASEPRPGPWCKEKYCPAYTACPETQRPLALVPDVRRLPLVGEIENDVDGAALIDAIPRFKEWVKDREAALKRRALAKGGIVLPDGRIYLVSRESEERLTLDVPGAVDALREVLGPHTEDAIAMRTSKEAIKRAARKAIGGKRGELGRVEMAAIDALRRIGAVKVSEHDEIKIRKPALPATGTET